MPPAVQEINEEMLATNPASKGFRHPWPNRVTLQDGLEGDQVTAAGGLV